MKLFNLKWSDMADSYQYSLFIHPNFESRMKIYEYVEDVEK